MSEYLLEMRQIEKGFPGVRALDKVDLFVRPGSIHALVGENGAGKSTLMKCLYGLYQEDAGEILLDGEKINTNNPLAAINAGIAMIHQELNAIPDRSIQDNIWLGRYDKKGLFVDEAKMYQKTKDLMEQLEFKLDPKTIARRLSVSELQAVEIAKAMSYNAKILIMDEPTSSLTNSEAQHLFKIIREIRDRGASVIYISHKMEEIFKLADEITIMRDGKTVGRWKTSEITEDEVIQKMVGRALTSRFPQREAPYSDEELLRVEDFTSANSRSFKNISFSVRKGEILGIGGLVGAQRTEMVESIFGLRPIQSGRIYKGGKEIVIRNPRDAIKKRLCAVNRGKTRHGYFPPPVNPGQCSCCQFETVFKQVPLCAGEGSKFRNQSSMRGLERKGGFAGDKNSKLIRRKPAEGDCRALAPHKFKCADFG